mgnify:FL=1
MTYKLDKTYEEKVYAGVLGKIIGVFLGRPFENWSYERIMRELGPINYYVNDKLDFPLPVSDDDITGTFTFLRAFKDFNYKKDLTAKDIGQTWLNNLIEDKTILWWGGRGHSAEDTAYQNLKQGIDAPLSGSIEMNGKVIAEQIGAQIFIDGWALVSPGDPEKAAHYAKLAASVSHDGEAIYGAQVVAAIEAMAFVENDISKLINESKKIIPKDSTIYKLISDLQDWRTSNLGWEQAREKIVENYGYDKFLGNCHMVPNHALIIMSLLYGDNDFQKTMMIVNTAGWDTDCNSGNVGCILGIKNGLKGLRSGPDYLSPINDVLYCPTAIGGETLTDALTESYKIINTARKINDLEIIEPKEKSRYHFELEGSTQGWKPQLSSDNICETTITNVEHQTNIGERALEISFKQLSKNNNCEVLVDTFYPDIILGLEGKKRKDFFHYDFISSPIVYPGQSIKTQLKNIANKKIAVKLFIKYWGRDDKLEKIASEEHLLDCNEDKIIDWVIPSTENNPIGQVGISVSSDENMDGSFILNFLNFDGEAKQIFRRPDHITEYKRGEETKEGYYGQIWRHAWVPAIDKWEERGKNFRICQNIGRGLIFTGTDIWKNYTVSSKIILQSVSSGGLVSRVQGVRRYYGFELSTNNKLIISKMFYNNTILKEIDFDVEFFKEYNLKMEVKGNKISGYVDDNLVLEVEDSNNILDNGGAGLVVADGTLVSDEIIIS